jgi:two-component system response regulator NreC
MNKIRVLIADDHAIVREGVKQALSTGPDIQVVGEAQDGDEALQMARTLRPDVVMLDISMPGLSGLDLVPLIKRALPKTEIIILSIHQKKPFVQHALSSGARGYVLKTAPIGDVVKAVHAAMRGEYYLSAKIEADVIGAFAGPHEQNEPSGYDALSEREQQVFRMVVSGKSNKQIGEILCLSSRTVEKHRATIIHKLNLRDTVDLVRYAVKIGILDIED